MNERLLWLSHQSASTSLQRLNCQRWLQHAHFFPYLPNLLPKILQSEKLVKYFSITDKTNRKWGKAANMSCKCYGLEIEEDQCTSVGLKSLGEKVSLSVPKQSVPGQLRFQGATSILQVTGVSYRAAVLRVRAAGSLLREKTSVRRAHTGAAYNYYFNYCLFCPFIFLLISLSSNVLFWLTNSPTSTDIQFICIIKKSIKEAKTLITELSKQIHWSTNPRLSMMYLEKQ